MRLSSRLLGVQTYRTLRYERSEDLPSTFENDVRTPKPFVEHFLREYTDPGDAVVDIFAGFGTTLKVAEELGRVPYGIEYEADRVAYVRERIDHPENLIHGSAFEVESYDLPTFDCCLTSPPFMVRGMTENPFENYAGESSYEAYLDDIRDVFATLERCLVPGGHALLDISNVEYVDEVTTLAWDVGSAISDVLHFDGEIIVVWEDDPLGASESESTAGGVYGYGYDHSYCLVFEKTERGEPPIPR